MFEFVEEPLDSVALPIDPGAEWKCFDAVRHGADVGPCAPRRHFGAQGIAVISAVGEQDVSGTEGFEHIGGRASVVGLALGQLEADRSSLGVNECMDLGGQAAARATHATGSFVFFWSLATCW